MHMPLNTCCSIACDHLPPSSCLCNILVNLSPYFQVSIDDFEMLKVLGRGTFGKVVVAREKTTREVVAIKILKKDVIIAKVSLPSVLSVMLMILVNLTTLGVRKI